MVGDRGGRSLGHTPSAPLATDDRLERLRRYARLLDEGIRIPGTTFRFGLDPILGLVPGFGDAVGAVLSIAIIGEAARRGVPRATLLRMAFNVAMDAGLGAVPVFGDVFDALWKANRSNLELLDRGLGRTPAGAAGPGVMVLLAGLLILCLGLAAAVAWLVIRLVAMVTA
jgi:hypothetical protein